MKITVRLYAGVRESAGCDAVDVELSGPATVATLRDALAEQRPEIADHLGHCRWAVRDDFADATTTLAEGAVVDLIPPVSGG